MAAIGLCAAAAAGQTPSFDFVGFPPGATASVVNGLSSDGSTAVGGTGGLPVPVTPGFVWTRSGGRYDFGLEPGMPAVTVPHSVSSSGGVVAGYMRPTQVAASRAFRWTGIGLPQDLGVLPGNLSSWANGISGDGQIVVGQSEVGNGGGNTFGVAFRWTQQTGMQQLPHLRPGGSLTQALGISRDGSTIVGLSRTGPIGAPYEAFSWTQGGGMVPLPGLPGAAFPWGTANAVSADGSVSVGNAVGVQGSNRMVRWTGGGVEDLGVLPGYTSSKAQAVSDDGLVVAGVSYESGSNFLATVWTPATGQVSLVDYLASSSVVVPTGWSLVDAHAVSGDGFTFAGQARSAAGVRQGFVATVPAPAGLIVFGSALLLRRRRGVR